jgi:1-acyl-sn-glycerol-3-phosphate acyltransferase
VSPASAGESPASITWERETIRGVWRRPWPHQRGKLFNQVFGRSVTSLVTRLVLRVEGVEHVLPENDPFVVVFNHTQKLEALVVPTTLIHLRGGKTVHVLCDWNYYLIPLVALGLRRSEAIPVVRKRARPGFLNVFKPWFQKNNPPALQAARSRLLAGGSVGIFPEGRANRHPTRMLRGQPGAARISLETGAPVVAGGIHFPRHDPARLVPDGEPLALRLSPPMAPPTTFRNLRAPAEEVHAWHDRIMRELSRVSGKSWPPEAGG